MRSTLRTFPERPAPPPAWPSVAPDPAAVPPLPTAHESINPGASLALIPAPGTSLSPRTDFTRIRQAGLVAGLAQGGPLGLSFALAGLARARGQPHLKVLGGFAPVLAAFLTAPSEQALRGWLGAQATLHRQPSLAHDAIPGAVLFLASLAWQRLPGPPRPPAHSPAGLAATVLVSMVGSLAGGLLSEASAQHAGPETGPPDSHQVVPALHKGIGRALTLLPREVWLQGPACLATAGRPLPRWTGLASTGVACVGWTFRRVLTSPPEGLPPPYPQKP